MHKLLVTLGIVALTTTTQAATVTSLNAVSFIAGLMDGVIHKDNLQELQQCLTNVEHVALEVEEIYAAFTSLSLLGIAKAIEDLEDIATYIAVEGQQCESIIPDVDRFRKWAAIFTTPGELMTRLAMNVPAHFNEILVDVQEANIDYEKGDFFECGENLGEAMVLAVGQAELTEDIF